MWLGYSLDNEWLKTVWLEDILPHAGIQSPKKVHFLNVQILPEKVLMFHAYFPPTY